MKKNAIYIIGISTFAICFINKFINKNIVIDNEEIK